jgi:DNA-binding FadR family transcriptional regulator
MQTMGVAIEWSDAPAKAAIECSRASLISGQVVGGQVNYNNVQLAGSKACRPEIKIPADNLNPGTDPAIVCRRSPAAPACGCGASANVEERRAMRERQATRGFIMEVMSCKQLEDLWDTRCCLEAMAARLACTHVSLQDIEHLRALCDSRDQAANRNDDSAVDDADVQFHRRIIDMSRNKVIHEMFVDAALLDRVFGLEYGVPSYWPPDEASPHGHRKIVEALAQRDADLTESLVRQQINAGKSRRLGGLRASIGAGAPRKRALASSSSHVRSPLTARVEGNQL